MIKSDCRFFNGAKPCQFNKSRGLECFDCGFYSPRAERVLIIKLDAIGDVLRTSCITTKIKERYPNSFVVWSTRAEALDLVRANPDVDEAWCYDLATLNYLQIYTWDYVYNCSNDHPSAALASLAKSRGQKIGFLLSEDGALLPANETARLWLEMAAFDSVKKVNELSFQQILYGICGFSEPIHRPMLALPDFLETQAASLIHHGIRENTPVIGVNTGAGSRWPRKMPGTEQMISVISDILDTFKESHVLLFGGPQELEKNRQINDHLNSSRVHDMGCNHSLLEFAALLSLCHVLLCGDTLAMHIASALKIPCVALFGPTSLSEIYSYDGLITKLAAENLDCLVCYNDCNKDQDCMTSIPNSQIMASLGRQLVLWRENRVQ